MFPYREGAVLVSTLALSRRIHRIVADIRLRLAGALFEYTDPGCPFPSRNNNKDRVRSLERYI